MKGGIVVEWVASLVVECISEDLGSMLHYGEVICERVRCINVAGCLPYVRWRIQLTRQRRQVGNMQCVSHWRSNGGCIGKVAEGRRVGCHVVGLYRRIFMEVLDDDSL